MYLSLTKKKRDKNKDTDDEKYGKTTIEQVQIQVRNGCKQKVIINHAYMLRFCHLQCISIAFLATSCLVAIY